MKPWFEKEADIIDFPKPERKVIKMPSVAEYPDFITGVLDLQARRDKGQIGKDSYDKLYTELIHRFMKKESFESPWFLREAPADQGIMGLPQAGKLKDQIEKAIADLDLSSDENVALLRKMYGILKTSGVEDRAKKVFSRDEDNTGVVLQTIGKTFLDLANGDPDGANEFLNQYEKTLNIVDTAALTNTPGQIKSTANLFVGDFGKRFGLALVPLQGNKYKTGYVGPGEIALSCLSNKVKLGSETGGDIVVDGVGYEVKGNEGRLFDKGQVSWANTGKYLKQSNMQNAGNLSVDDLASIDPEIQDVDADNLKVGKGKSGITSDQAIWVDKDQQWWNGFIKSLSADWFGGTWAKYSNELASRLGTGASFKILWLQLQFARYKEIAQHNGVLLIGSKRFVFATKGEHLKNNIKGWGTAYSPNIGQPRELSPQLKI